MPTEADRLAAISQPRPGDVWEKNGKTREIDESLACSVVYVGTDCCAPEIKVSSWRKWAATAQLICARLRNVRWREQNKRKKSPIAVSLQHSEGMLRTATGVRACGVRRES